MTGKAKHFTELKVWRKAHDLALTVYKITSNFPREETFGLSSQFRRAAVSVPANIAEGFLRKGKADKVRFMNIAQSSLAECEYYAILANDLGYDLTQNLSELQNEVSKMLGTYIKKIGIKI
jgi:four helix bundle protein